MAVYGLIFIFLSSRNAVFSPYFHYQMIVLPILIFMVPYGIKQVIENNRFGLDKPMLMPTLLGTLLISAILSGVMIGTLTPEKISSPRFTYTLSPRQRRLVRKVEKFVSLMEKDASVLASYSVAPFAAVRESAYVLDFYRPKEPTDYILLDRKTTTKKHLEKLDRQIKAGVYKRLVGRGRLNLYKHVRNKPFVPEAKHEKGANEQRVKRTAPLRRKTPPRFPPKASTGSLNRYDDIFSVNTLQESQCTYNYKK